MVKKKTKIKKHKQTSTSHKKEAYKLLRNVHEITYARSLAMRLA
jgi:hypothetical protein